MSRLPAYVPLGNLIALEGRDRCYCGCKYWENDRCIDCGTKFTLDMRTD